MNALLAPPEAQPSGPSTPVPVAGPALRRFLADYARTLVAPGMALAALLVGWRLLPVAGWPAAVAAVTGWSLAVAGWLHRRGWPVARAHLASWAGPGALLVPLAVLGPMPADGLVLWGPVSALLAVALAAVHDPRVVCLRG